MFGQPRYAHLNALINQRIAETKPLISVHRGTGLGSVVENTSRALQAAVQLGADMVEIDVIRSIDGRFYLFHDGYEPFWFHRPARSILTMTAAEIDGLRYLQRAASPDAKRVETLERALAELPAETLVNVDRSWTHWETLLSHLDRYGMEQRLVLKSPVEEAWLARLRAHEVKYPYIPIVRSVAEIEAVASDPDINAVGVELIAPSADHPFASRDFVDGLHERGLCVLGNAIVLENDRPLFARLDDEVSLFASPDRGWGALADLGVDIIQTDWPAPLAAYRRERALRTALPR